MMWLRSSPLFALGLVLACGSPPPLTPPSAQAPSGSASAVPNPSAGPTAPDPWQLPARVLEAAPATKPAPRISLEGWKKARQVKGVAPAPATCAAYVSRGPSKPAPASIDEALAEPAAAKRDAMLVAREGADGALARLVRADTAPIECADAIVDPWLGEKAKDLIEGEVEHALVGLSLAAKMARTAESPPQMKDVKDRSKVKAFIQGPLKVWMLEQASAIETLSLSGRELVGYGRGVAATLAGTAELRLVDNIRSSPVPKEWDAELKGIYEAALDEALEPRKARGRDAALVGLAELAGSGAIDDPLVAKARAILSKLYGGRRIDALDGLLLPPAEAPSPMPSPYWRRQQLATQKASASARNRFDRGRLYWHRADFIDAGWTAKDSKAPGDRLVLALCLALVHGPANAADMMRRPSSLELSNTDALDLVTSEGGPLAAQAAFDAAYLRALSPPASDAGRATHWRDVAERFKKAESLLADPADKKRARDRATDAEAAARLTENAGKKP